MKCTHFEAVEDSSVEGNEVIQLKLTSSNETIADVSMAAATVTVIDDSGMSVCVV